MNLIDAVTAAPHSTSVNWIRYKEAFYHLIDKKNYSMKAAASFISSHQDHSEIEAAMFYGAARHWRRRAE